MKEREYLQEYAQYFHHQLLHTSHQSYKHISGEKKKKKKKEKKKCNGIKIQIMGTLYKSPNKSWLYLANEANVLRGILVAFIELNF